jgi:hypothetical protein
MNDDRPPSTMTLLERARAPFADVRHGEAASFVRGGDVVQAGIVFVGERLALAVPAFAAINVVLVAAWLAVVGLINATKVTSTPAQPIAPARTPVVAAS